MLGDETLQLADQGGVAALHEVLLDALLLTDQVPLPQTGDLRLGEAQVAEVGERRAAPEPERLSRFARLEQIAEPFQVELAFFDPQEVAGSLGLQPLLAQGLPEPGDVDLQSLRCRFGRLILPERIDETILRDDAVGLKEQHGQQDTRLRTAKVERQPLLDHLEWAQDPELHPPPSATTLAPPHTSSKASNEPGVYRLASLCLPPGRQLCISPNTRGGQPARRARGIER